MSLFLIDKKMKSSLVSLKKIQLNQKENLADDSLLVSHTKRKNLKRKLVEDSLPVLQKKTSPDMQNEW